MTSVPGGGSAPAPIPRRRLADTLVEILALEGVVMLWERTIIEEAIRHLRGECDASRTTAAALCEIAERRPLVHAHRSALYRAAERIVP